jgi:tripartite ATP-independent transporter DctM subunit
MDPLLTGLAGLGLMFALIALHVPIGVAMGMSGLIGCGLIIGWDPALSLLSTEPSSALGSLALAVIPLFLLMGNFAHAGGLSTELYRVAGAFFGHRPGGLAISTVLGCAGFGAVCGSSVATAATMSRIALPEMSSHRYGEGFAAATIATGGTLGIIIPPSVILVLYGVLTENSITALFVASVIPGLLTVVFYMAAVSIYARISPSQAPTGPRSDWSTRMATVRECWAVVLLALAVGVGIYSGVFTVTEAASVGATFAFFIALARRRMTMTRFVDAIRDTVTSTALIFVIIIGASVFSYFVTLSGMPQAVVSGIESLGVAPLLVIVMLQIVYLIAGAIFDEIAAMVITLPFVYPLIIGMGYDPLWWGVVNVILISMGMIIPPIGINVFVVQSMAPHIPLTRIYRGIAPFVCADVARLAVITLMPAVCTWLPKATGWA